MVRREEWGEWASSPCRLLLAAAGPGEFTFPTALGFVGDTLRVRDLLVPRISRFLRDGSHLSTERVLADADYRTTAGAQGVSGYLQGDRAWMVPYGFVISDDPNASAPFILGDRALERQDTLFSRRAGRDRLAGTSFEPIAESPFHAVAPDGSGILPRLDSRGGTAHSLPRPKLQPLPRGLVYRLTVRPEKGRQLRRMD